MTAKPPLLFTAALFTLVATGVPSFAQMQPAAVDVAAQAAAPVGADRIQQAIDKGLAFLKSQQRPDGGWTSEQQPPAINALVLKAFAQDAKTGPQADFVKKGYERLLSYQVESGGIYKDALANYNTAISVSALAAANDPAYKDRIDKAVAYLKGLQWTAGVTGPKGESTADADKATWEGGWGYGNQGRPDFSNTQLALDALHDAGVKPDDPAYQRALTFIGRTQNRSESNDQSFAGNDGGFFYTPARGGESMAGLIDAGDKKEPRSYGSMTYAGLKSFIYAGVSKTDPRVVAAFDWISKNYTLDENPGMAVGDPAKARNGLFYYYHTMARALHAYGEETLTVTEGGQAKRVNWRSDLAGHLMNIQKQDGSWVGVERWMEDNPIIVTSYVVLALQEIQKTQNETK
jgi:squalene-hopene/tetraprenyl-beta-curcumene cyclase